MPRPRQANARSVTVAVRLSATEAAAVDRVRGSMSRGIWLRSLILKALRGSK